jgi:hypothetical protein
MTSKIKKVFIELITNSKGIVKQMVSGEFVHQEFKVN